jgi:preprotein translocase subunit SecB
MTIKIHKQYIKDLSIENPNPFKFFDNEEGEKNVDVNYDIRAQKYNDKIYELSFSLSMNIKSEEGNSAYILELIYAGIFEIDSDNVEEVLFIQCAELLFPFIRQLISDCTANSGIKTIILDLIDFKKLYQSSKKSVN